ncbi:MAG: FAD-dependent oxidoreductase, partial [Chromatiaceae bacterium]|nr:FAD-dependent oxidoreductase [Chromatiaceae bacterium]
MDKHFDLIAMGGGSGGLAIAEKAAGYGKRTAIVESSQLGGTCVNVGCVPKKLMWYASEIAQAVRDAPELGVNAEISSIDWPTLVKGREGMIDGIRNYWNGYVDKLGITLLQGAARFVDNKTIEATGEQYTAEHIAIATGGQPIVPPVPGHGLGITSDGFIKLDQARRRVCVIGGGYIGVELAGILNSLGSEVTIVAL